MMPKKTRSATHVRSTDVIKDIFGISCDVNLITLNSWMQTHNEMYFLVERYSFIRRQSSK